MINTKELRLGNLFANIEDNSIYKVTKINEDTIEGICINNMGWFGEQHFHLIEQVLPIKLTEEWLLKFGFNKDYKKGYIGKDFSNQDFVLTEPFVMGDWQKGYAFEFTTGGWSKYKEFNYVHELQNFYFTLTSEELTQVSEGENKNLV